MGSPINPQSKYFHQAQTLIKITKTVDTIGNPAIIVLKKENTMNKIITPTQSKTRATITHTQEDHYTITARTKPWADEYEVDDHHGLTVYFDTLEMAVDYCKSRKKEYNLRDTRSTPR